MTENLMYQIKDIIEMIATEKEGETLKPFNKKLNSLREISFRYAKEWDDLNSNNLIDNPKKLRGLEIKATRSALKYEEFRGIVIMYELMLERRWTPHELKLKKRELLKQIEELKPAAEDWIEDEWDIKRKKGMIKVINSSLRKEKIEKFLKN